MVPYIYIKTCVWVTIGIFSVAAIELPSINPSLEILDELNDAEIYNAVVSSMNEWQRRHNVKKLSNRIKRDEPSICYRDLGCFEAGYFDMLPSKPEEINTKFLLYPGQSRGRRAPPTEVPYLNLKEAFEWAKKGFNHTIPTKVLIHGFGSDCTHIWVYEMRSALMAVEEVNVICVDWENGAILPNYVKAAANTRLVGLQLALLLKGLVENGSLSLRNTHLIGFSLGAHVAGFTGAELGGGIDRITGLDPAGPLFEAQDPRMRLDQSDANFVDVIHSNGENLILGGLGSYQPMGHVDFYPNGGRMQKGCSNLFVGAVTDIIWSSAVEGRSLCNHRRAYKFFTDSVSPRCHFPAFPCDSYDDFLQGKCFPCTEDRRCGNMGYYADRSKGRGQLYLVTRDEEPFCAHQYHVKIETSPSKVAIVSYGKIQITLVGDLNLNETFMMTRKEDEEMKLGDSISRILVPHPILSEPVSVQILYTAYSGWLSSGLTQWRMDKLTISDSFGKTTSVCKKNLILESGVPVILPLYPGECNLPKEADDRNDGNITSFIVPTSSELTTTTTTTTTTEYKETSLFNIKIPWKNENDNKISDNEVSESSRAFNTRVITTNNNNDKDGKKEIVEPILKPHSMKNARSHDPNKEKSEISEPILGPTTAKNNFGGFTIEPAIKNDYLSKIDNKPINYNFYDIEDSNDWIPSQTENKWRREQDPNNGRGGGGNRDPFEYIASTVQFLPQRLARMFEQAEKYARETILPLVSTYTPKFISDFIAPRENKPRYLPLQYEETTNNDNNNNVVRKSKKDITNFDPPPSVQKEVTSTTPYTHIQKIRKKEKVYIVTPEPTTTTETVTTTTSKTTTTTKAPNEEKMEVSRKARDDVHVRKNILEMEVESTTTRGSKGIYIDLPVFESKKVTKYIPLFRGNNNKS